jgi:hypothetical protein
MEDEEKTKESFLKVILSLLFLVLVLFLLVIYFLSPFQKIEFKFEPINNNFNIEDINNSNMQFYENMRYPNSNISYKISEKCDLKKKSDMEEAIGIIDNLTIINFYYENENSEIEILCEDNIKIKGNFFIAGEGGPVNITSTDLFNVITKGKIILIEDSKCIRPNIAIHELLHALGFKHSKNPNNIMYNITKCDQKIGDDIINLLNELYSVQSYPDLIFDNASAIIHSRYLDLNITIGNNGLKKSNKINLFIYVNEKILKEFEIEELDIGNKRAIFLKNIKINKNEINEIKLIIDSKEKELNRKNNEIKLKK